MSTIANFMEEHKEVLSHMKMLANNPYVCSEKAKTYIKCVFNALKKLEKDEFIWMPLAAIRLYPKTEGGEIDLKDIQKGLANMLNLQKVHQDKTVKIKLNNNADHPMLVMTFRVPLALELQLLKEKLVFFKNLNDENIF